MRDMSNNLDDRKALSITAIGANGTTNGDIIDLQGYDAITFAFLTGTITDGTHAVTFQEGNDSGLADAAAVATSQYLGNAVSIVAADDNVVKRIGILTTKRYARAVITSSGVTTGGTIGAIAMLGRPALAPVAQ